MPYKFGIVRAKPNPVGKDKSRNYPLAQQLLGEWVDLKNEGDGAGNLSSICVAHQEYTSSCSPTGAPTIYWRGSNEPAIVVQPGEIVRIHTGKRSERAVMATIDSEGVHYHAFADSGNFVLNNYCGDFIRVYWNNNGTWAPEDAASYDRNPGEGVILVRMGEKLVPTAFR